MGLKTRDGSPYWWVELEGTKGINGRKSNKRMPTGIRHTGADDDQTAKLKQLAEFFYHEQMQDVQRAKMGLPPVTVEPEVPVRLFRDQAPWYFEHYCADHKSRGHEEKRIKRLVQTFGEMPLDQITEDAWKEYGTERRKEGAGPVTVTRDLAVMKRILTTATKYLSTNPLDATVGVRSKLPAKRTLNAREEAAVAAALEVLDPELRDIYLVGVGTLLRRANLVSLRRSDYQEDRLAVDTKSGPHQVPLLGPTPLQERAWRVLQARMPADPNGYFFPKWQAIFWRHRDAPGHASELFLGQIRRACRQCGIPWGLRKGKGGVVWHTMTRASGATRMHRDYQIDLRTVQLVGKWASLDQMMAYLGMDQEGLFNALTLKPGQALPIEASEDQLRTLRVQEAEKRRKRYKILSKYA